MQCGITCLQMICRHFGKIYSLDSLSQICVTTNTGVSFLGISKALNPNKPDLYSTELNYGTLLNAYQAFKGTNFTEKEQLGFIASVKNSRGQDITPTIALDLGSYVEAVLTCTQAEFQAMYGKYDGVMKKFKMMREQLKALKFVLED